MANLHSGNCGYPLNLYSSVSCPRINKLSSPSLIKRARHTYLPMLIFFNLDSLVLLGLWHVIKVGQEKYSLNHLIEFI